MSRDLDDLIPPVRVLANHLLVGWQSKGGLIVTQTWRSSEDQAVIWAQGRSTPGPIVTHAPPGYSWHEYGRAFDVAFKDITGKPTWDGPWEKLGDLGELLGLEWGGRWKHPDRPHFQETMGLTLAEMRTRPPYNPRANDG